MAERPITSVDVTWEGDYKFASRDAQGHTLIVGAPANDGDSFDGFMPGEMLLTSLTGYSSIDVVNILRRERQDLTGLEVRVHGVQHPDPPWTWEEIELEDIVRGRGLRDTAVERAIRLSETRYCSVGATLGGRARITSSYVIVEEGMAP